MKIQTSFFKYCVLFILVFMTYKCSDDTLYSDLGHGSLDIDTLSISNIDILNYSIAPNIGANERLYLGSKNGIEVPLSLIQISNSPFWNFQYDSTKIIDSLRFSLYSNDSLINLEEAPNLFFKSDSQFDENTSNYMEFSEFSVAEWFDLGQPDLRINSDTSNSFIYTELVWDIDTLLTALTDTLDSNLVRSFAIHIGNSDGLMEFYSEEATTGDKDPKITMFFRQTGAIDDSVTTDTLSVPIYSAGDLSILKPLEISSDSNSITLSNGMGMRSFLNIQIEDNFLPAGSVIRSADLILNYDTTLTNSAYNVIIDPIDIDTLFEEGTYTYVQDPYEAIGFPYRVSVDAENGLCVLSIKEVLQNISLGNVENLGFKLIANEKNDPFESIRFEMNQDMRLHILYVTN